MEEFIKWIIENKEIAILLLVTVSICIPISMRFRKTIINNNNKKITNNYHNETNNNSRTYNPPKQNPPRQNSFATKTEIQSIRLYSTGKKGKVYTDKFYKQLNHNFGIEILLKNNTNVQQNVKVGWCIYKDGSEIMKGTFNKKINANSTATNDFYVKEESFKRLKSGKYKSQFWVNDKRVQKVYFYILNK